MDELIRMAIKHEVILNKWHTEIGDVFAKQRRFNTAQVKINKFVAIGLGLLTGVAVIEDINLYQTDNKLRELEAQLRELKSAAEPVEEDNDVKYCNHESEE